MTTAEWDFIVVGAGSAGAVLAVRLAEEGKQVLLLEAGPDYRADETDEAWRSPNPVVSLGNPKISKDLLWSNLLATRTDAQPPAPYLRGRGAGGSSSVNAQIAIRPPVEDFDDMVRAGCVGWSAADVLPAFARLETDHQFGHETLHGSTGPTPVFRTSVADWGAVDAALARAAQDAGFAWADDVNAPHATGVSPYPINSRDGRRVSVNDAYLEPARGLRNLTVHGNALVATILFEDARAVGVSVIRDGRATEVYGKEIIVSAGAIHSPTILMRSGIGPVAHLEELGIVMRVDLPVGQGLQDHPTALVNLPLQAAARIKDPDQRHTNVCVRWTSGPDAPFNDLFFSSLNQNVISMAMFGTGADSGAYGVWLNKPFSRGSVTLSSPDPSAQPHINERMLSDPRDLKRMRIGVRKLAEIAESPATKDILAASLEESNGELFRALADDRGLDEYLLATVGDAQHATSTCRMGLATAPDTVVDADCRVIGVEALRVIDASIFPAIPRANTNLATIAIAETMASRIVSPLNPLDTDLR